MQYNSNIIDDDEIKPRLLNYDMKSSNISNTYVNNTIRTAKYNLLSFLPLNLATQFSKASNLYFLLIAYMQTIKRISISGGKSVMSLPLGAVVLASMVKDAYEDI